MKILCLALFLQMSSDTVDVHEKYIKVVLTVIKKNGVKCRIDSLYFKKKDVKLLNNKRNESK